MDWELVIWILIIMGGYCAVLGYLLRTALRKESGRRDA